MLDSDQPAFVAPEGACDAHFHVFGDPLKYTAAAAPLRYALPSAPLDDYLQLASRLGLRRQVFVQPSAYGRDNRCMLDAMAQMDPTRCRGIVDVHEQCPDSELDRMHLLGVRGVRINVSPVHPPQADLAQAMQPRIAALAARCAERGWHLDFLLPGWLTAELMPVLHALPVPFSMAHMGMNLAADGVDAPGFQALLALVKGTKRHAWVKFTGLYRISKVRDHADTDPMARALIEAAPDRLLWGSDYPHLSFADQSSVGLFNVLARWTHSEAVRRMILSDNPARLFGF
jgi:2-pyrone-4,6-dicarboxylate lactonase